MVNLKDIIKGLDPDVIYDEVIAKHDAARESYDAENKGKVVKAKNIDDMWEKAIKYIKHHHKETYNAEIDDHRAYAMAFEILSKSREQGGFFEGGLEEAISKSKKNMRPIFDALGKIFASQDEDAYRLFIYKPIDPQDFGTLTDIAQQYITRHKIDLPEGTKTKSPEELAPMYKSLIQLHADDVYKKKAILGKHEPNKKAANDDYKKKAA